MTPTLRLGRRLAAPALFSLCLLAAGCSDTTSTFEGPDPNRSYDQVQRLGNPLISEVLLEKRNHPLHGSIGPDQDAALILQPVADFITGTAGRAGSYATLLGSVLIPDMLIVQSDKTGAGDARGWLTWLPQLGGGYGGRQLSDDVVDLALLAVFGDPFGADPAGAAGKAGLTTDNVGSDSNFRTTFPYLAVAN